MSNCRTCQVEAISQLAMFAENLVDHHKQCTEIMTGLVNTLNDKWVKLSLVSRAEWWSVL